MIERPSGSACLTVGVVSDTHGYLYAEVVRAMEGVDRIIHAGDIGSPTVLEGLRRIAPVTAVRGNCDHDAWVQALPAVAELELGGARLLVGHIASHLRSTADGGRFEAVITGHTHLDAIETRDGTLYLNPGSAGPRRFGRPRTVARVVIWPAQGDASGRPARLEAEIVDVDPSA